MSIKPHSEETRKKGRGPGDIIRIMTLKQDIQAYQARWSAVQAVQIEEQLNASMELRWQQLNTVYGIAKGLGLLQWDSSEMEVFERWAKLKSQATNQGPKAS